MLKVIADRHSIRRYTDEAVSREDLEALLRSAMQAPTAKNLQDWRFLAILNKEDLVKISDFPGYYSMFKNAAASIVVMSDGSIFENREYCYADCGAACENILLEAVNLGLGAVWCAIGPNEDRIESFRKTFDIPAEYVPVAAIAIGHPAEDKGFIDRYDEKKIIWR